MTRLQVYNWGTFSGRHDIPISERGFLIVGRSGAGKSTLLDALSALLIPPRWIDFNAAAREAERAGRDRNLPSYVRGAWTAQTNAASGESAVRYLRTGTTWSALALHYASAAGQHVVLVQLFWIRGNANGNADVKRYFLILERPFDLREIGDFGSNNFDVRKLKLLLPDAFARDEFSPYSERFRRLLGIDSDMALRLLHKTQSAKNMGDLNAFLRDFMLDKPETFTVADRLVAEFGELNAAHQAVVTAREQVQTLAPARRRHQQMDTLALQRNALEELMAGMHSYRESLRIRLLEKRIAERAIEIAALAGKVQRQQGTSTTAALPWPTSNGNGAKQAANRSNLSRTSAMSSSRSAKRACTSAARRWTPAKRWHGTSAATRRDSQSCSAWRARKSTHGKTTTATTTRPPRSGANWTLRAARCPASARKSRPCAASPRIFRRRCCCCGASWRRRSASPRGPCHLSANYSRSSRRSKPGAAQSSACCAALRCRSWSTIRTTPRCPAISTRSISAPA
ncbi:ATP-binding protein [Massilia sp. X63]|uniref:ATP-binding protein n=1 Tax=Massilia sp. X63 TaxID=3237285 RepID=UPI0034DDC90F